MIYHLNHEVYVLLLQNELPGTELADRKYYIPKCAWGYSQGSIHGFTASTQSRSAVVFRMCHNKTALFLHEVKGGLVLHKKEEQSVTSGL